MAASTAKRPRVKRKTSKSSLKSSLDVEEDHAPSMSLRIHECRFFRSNFRGVKAMATSPSGRYLLVARIDGSIELKDNRATWTTTSLIPSRSNEKRLGITAVQFSNCNSYVFVSCLAGIVNIFRITIDGLLPHVTLNLGGGEIYDIAIDRRASNNVFHLAAACQDGRVRMVSPDSEHFSANIYPQIPTNTAFYEVKPSEKSSAPITCVTWAPESLSEADTFVVAGDADGGVRWINPRTGSCYGRGKIPSFRGDGVLMTTLQCARGGHQVLCGDSRGLVTVWSSATATICDEIRIDGSNGRLLSSALCRASVPSDTQISDISETVVFGSEGGEIAALKSVPGSDLWTSTRVLRSHSDKIQALCSLPGYSVVCGALDSFISTFHVSVLTERDTIKWTWDFPGCIGQDSVQFYPKERIALSNTGRCIEIWYFPKASQTPTLKLRMDLQKLSYDIRSCSYCPELNLVALANVDSFRLFQLLGNRTSKDTPPVLEDLRPVNVLKDVSLVLRGAIDMAFCGKNLICLSRCQKRVLMFKASHILDITPALEGPMHGRILCRLKSFENQVMVSDSQGTVHVCLIPAGPIGGTHSCPWFSLDPLNSGRDNVLVSAMSFSPSGAKIAIAYTDLRITVTDFGVNLLSIPDNSSDLSRLQTQINNCLTSIANSISFSSTEDSLLVTGPSFCKVASVPKMASKREKEHRRSDFDLFGHGLARGETVATSAIFGPGEAAVVSHMKSLFQRRLRDQPLKKAFGS